MAENNENENRFGMGTFVCVFNKDYTKIMLLYRNAEKRAKWGADWGNVGVSLSFYAFEFSIALAIYTRTVNASNNAMKRDASPVEKMLILKAMTAKPKTKINRQEIIRIIIIPKVATV